MQALTGAEDRRLRDLVRNLMQALTGPEDRRIRDLVRRRMRTLTGAEDRRLRDLVRSVLDKPPVVRLRDKFSFMFGVLGCGVVEAVALLAPGRFWMCYAAYIVPLLMARLYLYVGLGWHYFLLDFCYASNLLCLVLIFVWPSSTTLLVMNFVQATGPLAVAIPTWRNSLVFHSLDKVTSAYIHALPPLLCFLMRWYPPQGWSLPWPHLSQPLPDQLDIGWAGGCALGGYLVWQSAQLLITEVVFPAAASYDTSIRTLTRPKPDKPPPSCYSGVTKPVYVMCTRLGVMRKDELFDAEQMKTKLVFISVQLVYTALTVVPACYLWSCPRVHLLYLAAILAICVWNGASYYIEVFSKAYRKQFEGTDGAPPPPQQFQPDLVCEEITGADGSNVTGDDS